MKPFWDIAEQAIQDAIARGEFDNLPNAGTPINYQEYMNTPAAVRMMFKVMRDANLVPAEVELKRMVESLRENINSMKVDTKEREALLKELAARESELRMRLETFKRNNT